MTNEFKMFLGYTAAMVATGAACLTVSTSPLAAIPLGAAGIYGVVSATTDSRLNRRIDINNRNFKMYKRYLESGDRQDMTNFLANLNNSEAEGLANLVKGEVIFNHMIASKDQNNYE